MNSKDHCGDVPNQQTNNAEEMSTKHNDMCIEYITVLKSHQRWMYHRGMNDGFGLHWMVLDGIVWYCMVLDGLHLLFLCYLFVIQLLFVRYLG